MHVDDFIDRQFGKHCYARFVLNYFRMEAVLRADFDQFMAQHKLFCTHMGKRYRVTGASTLGDIFLARDFNREAGYDLRVDVEECGEWSDKPSQGEPPCIHPET